MPIPTDKKEVDPMADDDEYELLPHKQIADLKKELERLKKGPTPEARNEMERLNDSINNLLSLFKEASSQMHLEEQEATMVAEKLIPIEEKLDQILDQNQKIAEGIVALADLVKELKEDQKKKDRELPRPMTSMGPQPMGPMGPGPYPRPSFEGNLPPLGQRRR